MTLIRSDTTEAEWAHMKTDKVFETELGDIALVAAARAIHKDILVFITNKHISISPIEIICADHYEGGTEITKTQYSSRTTEYTLSL